MEEEENEVRDEKASLELHACWSEDRTKKKIKTVKIRPDKIKLVVSRRKLI